MRPWPFSEAKTTSTSTGIIDSKHSDSQSKLRYIVYRYMYICIHIMYPYSIGMYIYIHICIHIYIHIYTHING